MDIGLIAGIIAGMGLVIFGIITGGTPFSAFIDTGSILIVIGGGIAATFVQYPLADMLGISKIFMKALKNPEFNTGQIIDKVIELANVARREGLLALEEAVDEVNDEFLKKGVMLIVDGTDPEMVKNILETELTNMVDRHAKGRGIFEALGSLMPAFGMIGTLVGLVGMLQSLSDPSAIGPKMAVALLTTFYGSLFANLIWIPIAGKLQIKSDEEALVKEVMIEGLLSIQAGENPRIIEEKLKAFLSPSVRKTIGTQEEGEE
ncbi:motility protein A [Acidaminobacter sp. JC074]|uniref:motility protein A n=1 Tax=Acidaminobacter sp. JC074 TaxID=2530199 RepID=UPI001F0DE1ED|nr:motility protein A [Acidaminobacter sp. JC074]MCH4888728.1 motility protein A [Acidaminobacter sp. JC074]